MGSLIYSTGRDRFWLRAFGLQIRYALTCSSAFMISLTKPGRGAVGWDHFIIIITAALTGPRPLKLKAAQSVLHCPPPPSLQPGCIRGQTIRLSCNLFVSILIKDKHLPGSLCHRGSVLIWFWRHIKTFYCTLSTSIHCPHTYSAHTPFSLASFFSRIHQMFGIKTDSR